MKLSMQYIHRNGQIDCCEDAGIQIHVISSSDHVSVILSEIGFNQCV